MKNLKKSSLSIALILSIVTMNTVPAYAHESPEHSIEAIENYIKIELSEYAEEENIPVSFGDVNIELNHEDFETVEIENIVEEKLDLIKQDLSSYNVDINQQVMTRGISKEGNTYIAKVESLIPAIGWGYICQDFTASVSKSKINSVTLKGSSYDTGFTLGSWDHNYSWYDISSDDKYVQVRMKGTISYLWDLINISTPCTFLATGKASGSTIVSSTYHDWPD